MESYQISLLILTVLALKTPAVSSVTCDEFQNGNNYSAFESMLLDDEANLLELANGFFPTNYQSSVAVDIKYYFVFPKHEHEEKVQVDTLVEESYVNKNRVEYAAAPQKEETTEETHYHHFRWVISPINLFIRPNLLADLSLKTYEARNNTINLSLRFPCRSATLNDKNDFSLKNCGKPPAYLKQLNTLTTNVS